MRHDGPQEVEVQAESETDDRRPRRRRRRGRRDDRAETRGREPAQASGNDEGNGEDSIAPSPDDADATSDEVTAGSAAEIPGLGEQPPAALGEDDQQEDRRGRRRRRGRRGGRRGRDRDPATQDGDMAASDSAGADDAVPDVAGAEASASAEGRERPDERPRLEPDGPQAEVHRDDDTREAVHAGEAAAPEPREFLASVTSAEESAVHAAGRGEPSPAAIEPQPSPPAHAEETRPVQADPLKPARKGWWQRRVAVD